MKELWCLGLTMFLFGIIGWTYVVIIGFLREEWLKLPLTHLTLWLRTDTFGIICFIIALIGFFMFTYFFEVK